MSRRTAAHRFRTGLVAAALAATLTVTITTSAAASSAAVRAVPDVAPASGELGASSLLQTPQHAVDDGVAHARSEGITQFVSVVDRSTGKVVGQTSNANEQVASESIMKLFLAAYYLVLYGGYTHTPSNLLSRLSYMLRYSDDATASALFSASAIPTIAQRYGLSHTTNATDRAGHWGAARITANDMTRFLYQAAHDSKVGPWLLPVMAKTEPRGSDGFDQHFGLNALTGEHGSKQGWGEDSFWTGQHAAIHSVGYTSRYFVAILQLSTSYPDPARSTATYTARAIQQSVPGPPPEGSFVRPPDSTATYRVVGGAPVYVSSWTPVGGEHSVHQLDASTWNSLRTVPRDGTVIRAGKQGLVYRIAGGAPIRLTSWDAIGGYVRPVVVDPAAVAHAGGSGGWAHLRDVPSDGTLIRSGPHGPVYRISHGAPEPTGSGSSSAVVVDPEAIDRAGGTGSFAHLRLSAAAAKCRPYPDVNGLNSACENISWLKHKSITKPADGLYYPRSDITRGAMAAFLFRLANPGKAQPSCTARPFPDVSTSGEFCGYITWVKDKHIAFGYPDGSYGPSRAVTRGAMAAYLYRIAGPNHEATRCTSAPFADVHPSDTFCGVIAWAKKASVTFGVGDGTDYGTTLPVTRQAMASFLHRIATN